MSQKYLNAFSVPISILTGALLVSAPSKSFADQLYFNFDNDVIIGADGDYSNGVVVGWLATPATDFSQAPALFKWQSVIAFPQESSQSQWGGQFYHRMWTPTEIAYDYPQPNERPYAGLLELESFTGQFSSSLAQKNWLSIGVMGPASFADELQTIVHKITGSTTPKGWDYQIENQVTFQFAYEVDALLNRWQAFDNSEWDISVFNHTMAGNFRSQSSVGLTLRWGDDLAETFGQLSSQAGHMGDYASYANRYGSWQAYFRMQAGYRFNDLTIEGDLPYDSPLNIENQQAQASLGVIWAFPTWSVSWSFNYYSKEYESDVDDWHGYGVISYTKVL
ncbi:lipid A deacylase LpxR family protein [Shewanella electrodiphila]|uniref:Lipid A deacylase LpxR family protein n=1 Tax=Shewanella electrodiphila TaxID=934143 RepID=A0ABT0KS14_9GAMM|nr:lipid A deacylase LpxR family protein [Shewanella electrodiphila]MCL1046553.1 lipid A deacylase LpxR family protein [Shewanella electrodiphila]